MQPIETDLPEPPLSHAAERLIAAANAAQKRVECFDFVPSNYSLAWSVLTYLKQRWGCDLQLADLKVAAATPFPRTSPRFCELGSGLGVVTGLAAILGYQAVGIERDVGLASLSRELLLSHGLNATIYDRDMLEAFELADVYYAYTWASQRPLVEEMFEKAAPKGAFLVLCHGQSDLRLFLNC